MASTRANISAATLVITTSRSRPPPRPSSRTIHQRIRTITLSLVARRAGPTSRRRRRTTCTFHPIAKIATRSDCKVRLAHPSAKEGPRVMLTTRRRTSALTSQAASTRADSEQTISSTTCPHQTTISRVCRRHMARPSTTTGNRTDKHRSGRTLVSTIWLSQLEEPRPFSDKMEDLVLDRQEAILMLTAVKFPTEPTDADEFSLYHSGETYDDVGLSVPEQCYLPSHSYNSTRSITEQMHTLRFTNYKN